MNVFSYRLRPTTPWATELQADSLFGALCWEVVRRQGEPELVKMLDRFRKGDPPFVLSSAFPGEWMPRPLVVNGDARWITRSEFMKVREGDTSFPPTPQPSLFKDTRAIRLAGGKSVFETSQTDWADPAGGFFTLYARVLPEWVEPLRKLLQSVGTYGFGKRRGLGLGQFEVPDKPELCPWLEPMPFESGFVTLSNFVPQESDPTKGRWSIQVKHPKSSPGHSAHALKGRLLQLEAGSCFQSPGRPRRWYGSMLSRPGKTGPDGVVQYGLALAIGIKWPTDHL